MWSSEREVLLSAGIFYLPRPPESNTLLDEPLPLALNEHATFSLDCLLPRRLDNQEGESLMQKVYITVTSG